VSTTLDVRLSDLFPNLFGISRPIITPEVPVIVAASVLAAHDAPILPITKVGGSPPGVEKQGLKLFRAIGGQQAIRLVVKTNPKDRYKVLWDPCITTSMWLGALDYDDTLENLFRIFELTGFGDARVNARAPPHGLVTLEEVVSLYRERRLSCGMGVNEVSSRAISVDPGTALIEAMTTMCDKRVRRLFLKGRKGEFISDRGILALLFSPKALSVARDAPELWTDFKVSEVQSATAGRASPHSTVEEVGRLVDEVHSVFVLPDGVSLVSRWDLVMKPWKAGRLRLPS
jgi:CBS domain-containing protein